MSGVDRAAVLDRLFATIESRKGADPASSHTAKLFAKGTGKIAQKVGEEATETVIAALSEGPDAVKSESADLIYHLMVLWADAGLTPADIWTELERREGVSGIAEKASRKQE